MNELFTIGYSKHTLDSFLDAIQKNRINAVVDVRSTPYSRFKPEFNKDSINKYLKSKNINYVFLGNECGARFDDPTCYQNGKADYRAISKHRKFQEGLNRIKTGIKKYTVALMCAERDPINCHRMILICRNLKDSPINIYHILDNDKVETQFEIEKRLLKLFKFDQTELFRTEQEQLDQAYDNQSERIAFTEETYTSNNNNGGNINSVKY
jgi:uncharacterized protein (DUF488 family)